MITEQQQIPIYNFGTINFKNLEGIFSQILQLLAELIAAIELNNLLT